MSEINKPEEYITNIYEEQIKILKQKDTELDRNVQIFDTEFQDETIEWTMELIEE